MTTPRIVFFQVRTQAAKLKIICDTLQQVFEQKERAIVFTEDQKAQEFVDELLWKTPEMSFLPHILCDEPTKEFIAITKTKNNVNQANIAFNLCPTPLLIETHFRIIYEFEDLSHPHKNKLSSLRFDAYKAAKFHIESRS